MNDNENEPQSLQTWLDEVYLRYLTGLENAICEDHVEASSRTSQILDFTPLVPLQLDGCFVNTVYRQHALEVAGAFYNVLEVVIDFTTGQVIAANIFVQEQGKSMHVIPLKSDLIQTSMIEGILHDFPSAREMSDESLEALFASAKTTLGNATTANETAIPSVDILRVIDARVFEQMARLERERMAISEGPGTSLQAVLTAFMTWLSCHVDGMIRCYPLEDKLSGFLKKIASIMHDVNVDDMVKLFASFLPRGSLAIVAYTGDAITAMRAEKDATGQVLLSSVEISANISAIQAGPGNFDAMGRALKNATRVDTVLFFSIDGLADAFTNFMDSIMAKDHDVNGPGLVQVTAEALLLYLRTFEQTWYALPKPMLFKLFARFLLRFIRLHLDLPRLLNDRVASLAVNLIHDNFGPDFTMIACMLFKEKENTIVRACTIEIKGLIPRKIELTDPALLDGIGASTMEATMLAKAIHENVVSTLSSNPTYVFVLTPRFTAAIASAVRSMFKRVAVNPFSLISVVKAFKNQNNFGLHPVPPGIAAIFTRKPVMILREISTRCFLKY